MKHIFLSGFALMIFTIPVSASMQVEELYNQLDADRNGYISLNEVNGKHRIFYYYQKADKNGDGHIDKQEFVQFEKEVPNWDSGKYK